VPTAPPLESVVVLEDVLALIVRVFWDRAQGGTVVDDLLGGLQDAFQGILTGKQAGLDAARQHLEAWLAPVINKVSSLGSEALKDSTADEIFASGGLLVGLLADLAQNLPTNEIRDHLDTLLGILANDLGITNTALNQTIASLFTGMADRVKAAPASASAAMRENRTQAAIILRRLARKLPAQFALPTLNADVLAGPMLDRMRRGNYDDFARRAANIGKAIDAGFTLCGSIIDLVPFSLGVSGGMGAADAATQSSNRFAWYASWLRRSRLYQGDPGTKLTEPETVGPEGKQTTFDAVAFAQAGKDFMEAISRHSRWAQYDLELICTMIPYFRKGNYVNGTLQALLSLTDSILAAADVWDVPWWVNLPAPVLFVLLGSLEGRSPDGLLYPMRLMVKGLRKFWFDHTFRTVRDSLLSVFTLLNNRTAAAQPSTNKPLNRNEFIGLAVLFTELWTLLFAALVPHAWYSVNFNVNLHPGAGLVFAWLGSWMGAIVLGYVFGFFSGWAISGEPGQFQARSDWVSLFAAPLTFMVYWYHWNEGDTNDGKLGYSYPPNASSVSQVNTLTFNGYPNRSASPYSLPFEKGTSAECVQGNHGLWSHNAINSSPQQFAYDFSLPYGTEILCMRDGVVVATNNYTVDSIPDGQSGNSQSSANMVMVMHTTQDPVHDQDVNGKSTVTYAWYLHGAQNSIPGKFKAVVATGNPVKKGQVIMKVDSTGVSRLNHVHVDIRPDNGSASLTSSPITIGTPQPYTIPFVFQEVGGDGVPKSNYYYESNNEKQP
jgi:murein DD-endopeptidase MepM/ murein hydrolase activator NlpD